MSEYFKLSKWDRRFLNLCSDISQWSCYPRTKVGAVIVRPDNSVVSVGYNGFAKGADDAALLRLSRDEQLRQVYHAEYNAIRQTEEDLKGCTIYVWPLSPCVECAEIIINSGISRVVAYCQDTHNGDWTDSFNAALELFKERNVEVTVYG